MCFQALWDYSRSRVRTKLTVGITVMIGAVVLFFLSGGGKSGKVFYMTPTEFLSSPANAGGRVRLMGRVEKESVKASGGAPGMTFVMSDGGSRVQVRYKGVVPEAFAEGMEVVVDGRMSDTIFEARDIIVKCPSKYESRLEENEKKVK